MATRMAAVGLVTVSLRTSMVFIRPDSPVRRFPSGSSSCPVVKDLCRQFWTCYVHPEFTALLRANKTETLLQWNAFCIQGSTTANPDIGSQQQDSTLF
jgi:hypothetical protein